MSRRLQTPLFLPDSDEEEEWVQYWASMATDATNPTDATANTGKLLFVNFVLSNYLQPPQFYRFKSTLRRQSR